MELSYVNKHLLVLVLAQVCLISSFSALLWCWPAFITVLLFSALPNDMTLVWLSCVCVVMCCRSPTWTRSIPVCFVRQPWRNFISISNSVGGSCLETRTCQVVLRLVWLVALRHRISATYSCGTSKACIGRTVIVTFCKHVQYDFSFPDKSRCLIRGDKIDFFAWNTIICSSMILIKNKYLRLGLKPL